MITDKHSPDQPDIHQESADIDSQFGDNSPSESVSSSDAASKDIHHVNDFSPKDIAAEHEALRELFGLDKPVGRRGKFDAEKSNIGFKPYLIIALAICAVIACIAAWIGYHHYGEMRQEALALAKHQHELEMEQARRDRIEYADIAFLDSIPPLVAISMEGKSLYARTKDGAYTELRARESTWIQNLPIKEDTVLHFGFDAEGFNHLTRSVAYYDWFPSNKPGANPLQKAFKKIVLEPDLSPRVQECSQMPAIADANACEWTVFREIVFRERYAEAVKSAPVDESMQRKVLRQNLELHPNLAADVGFDLSILDTHQPYPPADASDRAKSLVKTLTENPWGLYGTLTIETDTPQTRVFLMSEPLMIVKDSGAMSQVQIQPDKPYTFSVYGQGRPLEITQNMTLRLEAPNMPAYITEISPLQWHCNVQSIEKILTMTAPNIAPELVTPDYRHYLCDYTLKISVKFKEIKELENMNQKADHENPPKDPNTLPIPQ